MARHIHFLNGKLVSEKNLVIPVRDLGFTRGYAVFDFFITYNGKKPFMLDAHLHRLLKSAKLIGLKIPWTKSQLALWVKKTLAANGPGEKTVKIIVSGGSSASLLPEKMPTIVIMVDEHKPLPARYYQQGVGAITVKFNRYIPTAKTNNYIEGVKQAQIAKRKGALEPIYYDDYHVFEGSVSNIFIVKEGRMITSKTSILEGITRDVVLDIVDGIPMSVADFTHADLMSADEAFFTGSNKEILPITKIDGSKVGDGSVGPVTRVVMEQFRAYTKSKLW